MSTPVLSILAVGLEIAKFVRHEQLIADMAAKAGVSPEDLKAAYDKGREDYKKLRDPNTLAEVTT